MRFLLVLVAAAGVLLVAGTIAACSGSGGEATVRTDTSSTPVTTTIEALPTTTTVPASTTGAVPPEPQVPEQLVGLELFEIDIDDTKLLVAVADTPELRRSGLMFVEDLGDIDGMLFIFEEDTSGGFWMKNTLLPLDIAFFEVTGRFVDGFAMEPCTVDPCPTYSPNGSYRYVVEMEAGTMPDDPQELTLPSVWADRAEEG
jgi:hypothetical protein